MRWIADDDKARLEEAIKMCGCGEYRIASVLKEVLRSIARLETEQPSQMPRIRDLSIEEHKKAYPERWRNDLTDTGHCPQCSRLPVLCECLA